MKIIYSKLKRWLPDLQASPDKVAEALTLIGHMCDGREKKEGEEILSLEVRQNRGDCLGYFGIARDLAVWYKTRFFCPSFKIARISKAKRLPIRVATPKGVVIRLLAVEIAGIDNQRPSPPWLQKFLRLSGINTINLVVDLTNFVMFWYGLPSHAFDVDKSGRELVWKLTEPGKGGEFITLDGTRINLTGRHLVIGDNQGIASLSMIGSQRAAIEPKTKRVIVEMALYNRVQVRRDAQALNIRTEAGIRLEKDLDPELIPQAFAHLVALIEKYTGGKVASQVFDYYPKKVSPPKIEFDPTSPSKYSGVRISPSFAKETLKNLGCQLQENNNRQWVVVPPSYRKDLALPEDLIEEVIRFWGYQKIPTNAPLPYKKLPDITPKILYLTEKVRDILIQRGYDEVRLWPLIRKKWLRLSPLLPKGAKPVYTENNINADYPLLRPSMVSSLREQKITWVKYRLPQIQFFEIGKVFYQKNGKFGERWFLGFYHQNRQTLVADCRFLLQQLGVTPSTATKKRVWVVVKENNDYFVEIDLEQLVSLVKLPLAQKIKTISSKAVVELNRQLVVLDANLVLSRRVDPAKLVAKYQRAIGQKHLWLLTVIDIYRQAPSLWKYTLRAFYVNLSFKKAKALHFKVFGLGLDNKMKKWGR